LAEKLFAKCVTEMVEGRYFEAVAARTTRFEEMVDKYLSKHARSRDERSSKQLLAFFSGLTLSQITAPLVAQFQEKRLEKVKPATVYQELSLLRRMFNVVRKRWKWVKDNPVSDGDLLFSVGDKNARHRWLTVDEEKALLDRNAARSEWGRSVQGEGTSGTQDDCHDHAICPSLPRKFEVVRRDFGPLLQFCYNRRGRSVDSVRKTA
jgi:hypothetical protein